MLTSLLALTLMTVTPPAMPVPQIQPSVSSGLLVPVQAPVGKKGGTNSPIFRFVDWLFG